MQIPVLVYLRLFAGKAIGHGLESRPRLIHNQIQSKDPSDLLGIRSLVEETGSTTKSGSIRSLDFSPKIAVNGAPVRLLQPFLFSFLSCHDISCLDSCSSKNLPAQRFSRISSV
jgi:hypothetical protein